LISEETEINHVPQNLALSTSYGNYYIF
jgi:hypothetical protein